MRVAPPRLRPPLDPHRAALQSNALRARRVARLVRGREPIERGELVAIVAVELGVSRGAAAAAVERALDDGQVTAWITLPAPADQAPDPAEVLDALRADTEAVADARRGLPARAGEGAGATGGERGR